MPVIDASVAVKFVVEERGSVQAQQLIRADEPLIAPDWMLIEVGHALWKKVRSGVIEPEGAIQGLAATPKFFQELHSAYDLLESAYQLAFRLQHWLYDCLYLELALRQDVPLVTADEAFVKAATRGGFGGRMQLLES